MIKSSRKIGICLTTEIISFRLNIEDEACRCLLIFVHKRKLHNDYLRKDKISKTIDLANGMTSTNSRGLSISVITQVRVSWTVPLK